jgi:hypothetical protein
MEPYWKLMTTEFDEVKKQFIDYLDYDGYNVSVIVSAKGLYETCDQLDYLFHVPSVASIPTIANLQSWTVTFYDHKERKCTFHKIDEYIYLYTPHYQMIKTDVSSGIAYLRIFHDTVKHMLQYILTENIGDNVMNTAQILSDDE